MSDENPFLPERKVSNNDVKLAQIVEGNRTIRTVAVCVVIVVGLVLIGFSIQALTQPSWLTLILALVGPSGLFAVGLRLHFGYVKKTHKRTNLLERVIDPNRTSSESGDRQNEREG